MTLSHKGEDAYPEGYAPRPHESLQVVHAEVSARYFESLHIPVLEGREFTPDDNEKAPRVLIVDQTAARRYWPGQDPLGKNLMVWGRLFTVVGVARNSTHTFVIESPEPMVYMSFFQAGYETIVQVETEGNPARPGAGGRKRHPPNRSTAAGFRCAFPAGEHPDGEQFRGHTEHPGGNVRADWAGACRNRESTASWLIEPNCEPMKLGIRMALGASRVDVLRLVLLQGLWLTGIGLALGLAFALGTDTFHRPAVVRNRSQRSSYHGLRRHAPGSNVFAGVLLSGTSSDASEPRDRDSRAVRCSSDSTLIGPIRGMRGAPPGCQEG